jgi:hypothetical protein
VANPIASIIKKVINPITSKLKDKRIKITFLGLQRAYKRCALIFQYQDMQSCVEQRCNLAFKNINHPSENEYMAKMHMDTIIFSNKINRKEFLK